MASKARYRAADDAAPRRKQRSPSDGDRRVKQAIRARRDLATPPGRDRASLDDHGVGGADSRYAYLKRSHD